MEGVLHYGKAEPGESLSKGSQLTKSFKKAWVCIADWVFPGRDAFGHPHWYYFKKIYTVLFTSMYKGGIGDDLNRPGEPGRGDGEPGLAPMSWPNSLFVI